MSSSLSRLCWGAVHFIDRPGIRHRWIKRGISPETAKSLAQKVAEWNWKDPQLHYRVNIGYATVKPNRRETLTERLETRRNIKANLEMEKAAKNRTLSVPVDGVYEDCMKTNGSLHLREAAEYFNVYQDLFEDAYFNPVIPLDIRFEKEAIESRVYCGNLIAPREASNTPSVTYTAKPDALYTLVLTTPDCHLTETNGEYLHWLVGNIPGNSVEKGTTLCNYMQPFPFRGIGFCRYVFVLYKQEKKLDFSKYERPKSCKNLTARTFSTYDFYRDYQEFMTPAGLSFFQSNWDQSLTDFFHNSLEMKEPVFEYDFPPITLRPQKWFPVRQPFNLYLDKYKDTKELQKELLLEKLKERHPFKPPPTPPKYPLAHRLPQSNPSWLNCEIKRRRMREGKWKFM